MNKMVTFSKKQDIRYIEKVGTFLPEKKGTRRSETGSPKRKTPMPTRYWTYKEAKTFLDENGFSDLLQENSVQKLARLMDGRVRRKAHEKNIGEKLEDFQDLLADEETTLGDLRQVVLSGGSKA
jgi:hypothetical protein